MTTPRRFSTVLVCTVLAAQLAVADTPQNDAGSGGDAPDVRADALVLAGPGAYAGELRSRDDDWYATTQSGPTCVVMRVEGDTDASTTLALRTASGVRSVTGQIPTTGALRLALAGDASLAWHGFERTPNPVGYDPARPRHYSFTLDTRAPDGNGDAGTSGDAGGILGSALPATGACTEGQLRPLGGLGDATDLFTFHATEGTQVIYSLGATAPLRLRIAAPDGAALGEIGTDGVGSFVAPTTGTYSMSAGTMEGTAVIDYVVGLMGPDPPGSPCRPHCMVASG